MFAFVFVLLASPDAHATSTQASCEAAGCAWLVNGTSTFCMCQLEYELGCPLEPIPEGPESEFCLDGGVADPGNWTCANGELSLDYSGLAWTTPGGPAWVLDAGIAYTCDAAPGRVSGAVQALNGAPQQLAFAGVQFSAAVAALNVVSTEVAELTDDLATCEGAGDDLRAELERARASWACFDKCVAAKGDGLVCGSTCHL